MQLIGVVGSGQMGAGMAQVAGQAGYEVTLVDLKPEFIQKGLATIDKSLGKLTEKGILTKEAATQARARIASGTDNKALALLLKYDSIKGRLNASVELDGDNIVVNGKPIKVLAERDPANLGWGDLGVDIAVASTGRFTNADDARKHLTAGA